MACLFLSLCNPAWLGILVLTASIAVLLPHNPISILTLAVAVAPIFALLLSMQWLTRLSLIFNISGKVIKSALLLLAFLYLIEDESYFSMIALAERSLTSGAGVELALLSIVCTILSFAALATLLLVLLVLIAETSVRLVAGQYGHELGPLLEGLRALLIVTAICLAARPLLDIFSRGF